VHLGRRDGRQGWQEQAWGDPLTEAEGRWLVGVGVLGLALWLVFYRLGEGSLYNWDEAIYAQAAKEFEAFVRNHPESPKVATAQVRHGEALLLSGDRAGCAILERAQGQYPRARAGALAKDLLGQHCRPS